MSAIEQEITDERLARSLSAGEAAAFDELYRRYARRLAAYGAGLLGDASAGEDVAQIALFNAYQAMRRGSEPAHVRAWLFRIAQNAALEILSRRRQLVEFSEEHHRSADPQELSAARGALIAALATLPERQRAAYLLREVRGLRVSEIADRLSLTTEQVEQALFAARNRLAEHLAFGDGLDCETARVLGDGGVHRTRQRALKRHLRSCVSCRAATPRRRRLGVLTPLAGLRDAFAWLLAGGSVSAAKVGVMATAAAVAVGTPVLGGDASTQAATTPIGGPRTFSVAAKPAEPMPSSPARAATKRQPSTLIAPAAPVEVADSPVPASVSPSAPAQVTQAEEDAPAPTEPAEEAPVAAAEENPAATEEEYVGQAPPEEVEHGQEQPAAEDEPAAEEEPVAEEPVVEEPVVEEPVAEDEPVDTYGGQEGEDGSGEQPKVSESAPVLQYGEVTATTVGADFASPGSADSSVSADSSASADSDASADSSASSESTQSATAFSE